jgi:type II secretory pathway pseudopilin PulG
MELMVSIVILAVIAGIAIPSIQTGLRHQAIMSATLEAMHLVDVCRIQAISRNRAYELVVDMTFGDNGRIQINESATTKCSGFSGGIATIRELDFNEGDYDDIRIVKTIPAQLGTNYNLCFKPDGRVIRTDNNKPVPSSSAAYGAGNGHVVLQRIDSYGNPLGVKHHVVIPYNGIPRFESGG